jgi:hypothetical protein
MHPIRDDESRYIEVIMKNLLISIVFLALSSNVLSATPSCSSSHGGYCAYIGKVDRIYINSGNLILLYFDTPMPIENASNAGFTITNGGAAAYNMSDNLEFAKMFYSTALAAQASGREVSIQMRGNQSGFMKLDRIWLKAP